MAPTKREDDSRSHRGQHALRESGAIHRKGFPPNHFEYQLRRIIQQQSYICHYLRLFDLYKDAVIVFLTSCSWPYYEFYHRVIDELNRNSTCNEISSSKVTQREVWRLNSKASLSSKARVFGVEPGVLRVDGAAGVFFRAKMEGQCIRRTEIGDHIFSSIPVSLRAQVAIVVPQFVPSHCLRNAELKETSQTLVEKIEEQVRIASGRRHSLKKSVSQGCKT
ncbi:hypothetical protein NE237_015672 [Protea cynaroides]|uniref:Uncharacterized protein n=1 Tax=Protea cynaroides TaxID=273540 RepID=A0A9Q0KER7_9MAGN|nr:hypothetical protein NE237_015672 [Protea cynaroides]